MVIRVNGLKMQCGNDEIAAYGHGAPLCLGNKMRRLWWTGGNWSPVRCGLQGASCGCPTSPTGASSVPEILTVMRNSLIDGTDV